MRPYSGLRNASFEIGLRQDVWVAMVNRRPVQISSRQSMNLNFSPADDGVWANRMVYICAEAINWCFGKDKQNPSRQVVPKI